MQAQEGLDVGPELGLPRRVAIGQLLNGIKENRIRLWVEGGGVVGGTAVPSHNLALQRRFGPCPVPMLLAKSDEMVRKIGHVGARMFHPLRTSTNQFVGMGHVQVFFGRNTQILDTEIVQTLKVSDGVSDPDHVFRLWPQCGIHIHDARLCDFGRTFVTTLILFVQHCNQLCNCPVHEFPNFILKATNFWMLRQPVPEWKHTAHEWNPMGKAG